MVRDKNNFSNIIGKSVINVKNPAVLYDIKIIMISNISGSSINYGFSTNNNLFNLTIRSSL